MMSKLMEGCKIRLEVTECGKVTISKQINMARGFLEDESYSDRGNYRNAPRRDRWL